MKCVLCKANNIEKDHYVQVHHVDQDNIFFKKFIEENQKVVFYRRKCDLCQEFVLSNKAEHDFVRHYGAGSSNKVKQSSSKPLNVVTLGSVKKIEIAFNDHSQYYDFYDSVGVVDSFLAQVKDLMPRYQNNVLIRAGFSIENIQQVLNDNYSDPLVQTSYWSTEPYQTKSFNNFVSFKIREGILRRVINNNLTGSAWHFNRFNYLNVKIVNEPLEVIK